MEKTLIKLPVDSEGNPDWGYMENYAKNMERQVKQSISEFISISYTDKNKTDISSWESYRVGDLFSNIVKPYVYHTKDVTEDSDGIPYVVRSKFNNGIKYLVKKKEDMKTSPAGVISFGAENATFFYQSEEWCSGRDIYYIDTRNSSKYVCYFLISCLMCIIHKYSYNYGLFPDLLKEEHIKLPTKDGKPDWKYMERYMKNVEVKTRINLSKMV